MVALTSSDQMLVLQYLFVRRTIFNLQICGNACGSNELIFVYNGVIFTLVGLCIIIIFKAKKENHYHLLLFFFFSGSAVSQRAD